MLTRLGTCLLVLHQSLEENHFSSSFLHRTLIVHTLQWVKVQTAHVADALPRPSYPQNHLHLTNLPCPRTPLTSMPKINPKQKKQA